MRQTLRLLLVPVILAVAACATAQVVLTGVRAGRPSAPAVVTTGASSIGQTSATLLGTANPNGFSTSAYFVWGSTPAEGNSTTPQSIGSGSSPVSISAGGLSGLSCNTTYYFHATATNSQGTINGVTKTLMTSACPIVPTAPAVITSNATGIGQTTGTLVGTVNPSGSSTTAQFQWGVSVAFGSATQTQALGAGTSVLNLSGGSLTGLVCNTNYFFRATATNGGGTTNGSTAAFTTSACTPPPPTPPTVITTAATGVGQTFATLTGTANPNNASTAAGFQWGRTAAFGNFTAAQDMGAGNSPLAINAGGISNLLCNTGYVFRATATNGGGTTNGSALSFTTSACTIPPTAPIVVTGSASSVTTTTATLVGTANPGGSATSAYFQWGTTTGYGTTTASQSMGSGTSALSVGGGGLTGLTCNTTYHFRVLGTNSVGTTLGSDASFTTSACVTTAYYVSTAGNDANPCTLSASPLTTTAKRTIDAGLGCLAAGRLLYVRGGTYVENINASHAANGTDWTTNAVSISGYPSETVTVQPSGGTNAVIFPTGSVVRYQIWTAIGVNAINVNGDPTAGNVYIGHDAHHIRWQQSHLTNGNWTCVSAFQGPFIEILDNEIDHCGRVGSGAAAAHGIYESGFTGNVTGADQHNLIRGNNIHDITGRSNDSCIQIFTDPADTNALGGTVVEKNTLRGCSVGTFLADVTTVPIRFSDNIINGTGSAACINVYARIAGALIYNNTLYGCADVGVGIGEGGSATNILVRNNAIINAVATSIQVYNTSGASYTVAQYNDLSGNGANTPVDPNLLSTFSNNISVFPGFTNPSGGDFSLLPASSLINMGTTLASVPTDIIGTARPQCGVYDISAYESVVCP